LANMTSDKGAGTSQPDNQTSSDKGTGMTWWTARPAQRRSQDPSRRSREVSSGGGTGIYQANGLADDIEEITRYVIIVCSLHLS